jgi:hypothetical protein
MIEQVARLYVTLKNMPKWSDPRRFVIECSASHSPFLQVRGCSLGEFMQLRTEEDAAAAAIYLKFFRLEAVEKGKQL